MREFTTFCGCLDELNGLAPEDGVASSIIIAQVWRGPELVADCSTHDWAEPIASAMNEPPNRPEGQEI